MKKLIYLSLVCLLVLCYSSCSSDDDSGQGSKNILNPPSWIIGTWRPVESEYKNIYKFEFTKNNFIVTLGNTNVFDFSERAKQLFYTVTETENNNSVYHVNSTLDASGGQSVVEDYIFKKVSDTRMTYAMPLGLGKTYDIVMEKIK